MITPAQRAEIRRLYYAEHWKVGTMLRSNGAKAIGRAFSPVLNTSHFT